MTDSPCKIDRNVFARKVLDRSVPGKNVLYEIDYDPAASCITAIGVNRANLGEDWSTENALRLIDKEISSLENHHGIKFQHVENWPDQIPKAEQARLQAAAENAAQGRVDSAKTVQPE